MSHLPQDFSGFDCETLAHLARSDDTILSLVIHAKRRHPGRGWRTMNTIVRSSVEFLATAGLVTVSETSAQLLAISAARGPSRVTRPSFTLTQAGRLACASLGLSR